MKTKRMLVLFIISFTLLLTGCIPDGTDDDPAPGPSKFDNFVFWIIPSKTEAVVGERIELSFGTTPNDFSIDTNYISVVMTENNAEAVINNEGAGSTKTYYITSDKAGTVVVQATYNEEGIFNTEKITITFKDNEIATIDDLKNIVGSDKTYSLINDLDLSGIAWDPISDFTGVLDGNGFKISNLSISNTTDSNVGLFDTLKGEVKNLEINNASITVGGAGSNLGIVAGINQGTITNVTVSGTISAASYDNIGGIAGYSKTPNITDCESDVDIIGNEYIGGIVGVLELIKGETFNGNTNSGDVSGELYVGGLIGYMSASVAYNRTGIATVTNSSNTGAITANNNYAGGIIGKIQHGTYNVYVNLSGLSNTGAVTGEEYVGGIVGSTAATLTLESSTNAADITGYKYVGGFIGYGSETKISGAVNNNTITGKAYIGGIAGYIKEVSNSLNTGEIISTHPLIIGGISIGNIGGIAGFAMIINDCQNDSDITVTHDGANIGGIAGYLRLREGYEISDNENNGIISTVSNNVGGLFGYVYTNATYNSNGLATISDSLNTKNVTGLEHTGGLIGYLYSGGIYHVYVTLSNMTNEGNIIGQDYTGGIIGHSDSLFLLSHSSNKGDVTGYNYVGGYVGYTSRGEISHVTNDNTITGYAYMGGIIGSGVYINNAENNGDIISSRALLVDSVSYAYIGGIAGAALNVTDSTNTSDITVQTGGKNVGGIVGYLRIYENIVIEGNTNEGIINSNGRDVGGIIGCAKTNAAYNTDSPSTMVDNVNKSAVTGTSYVGGIIGNLYTSSNYEVLISISDSENSGVITGGIYVGGIVGYTNSMHVLSYSINTGNISGENYVGGYVGYGTGATILNVSNSNIITGKSYVGGIAGYAYEVSFSTNSGQIYSTGATPQDDILIANVGGIVGYAYIVTNNTNNTDITVQTGGKNVGGIVGYLYLRDGATIENNINNGDITVNSDNIGGIIGYARATASSSGEASITNCENTGAIAGAQDIGGIVGQIHSGSSVEINTSLTYNNNSGSVHATTRAGGIIGASNSINNSSTITDTNTNTGNIIGTLKGDFIGELYS